MRVEDHAKALRVTKGSFYWHFKDRAEFRRGVLERWIEDGTDVVIGKAREIDEPVERIRWLYFEVMDHRMARFESVFHHWATSDREVAQLVAETDRKRHDFATWMFREMGFAKHEATVRGRMFVDLMVGQTMMYDTEQSPAQRRRRLRRQLELLTS
jgi:AcrR family transcriptional regulator